MHSLLRRRTGRRSFACRTSLASGNIDVPRARNPPASSQSYRESEISVFRITAHIQPHIHYASSVWDGASENNLKKLNSLHRRAAKLIADQSICSISTDAKLQHLGILPLHEQFLFNKLVFMYKITKSKAPAHVRTLFCHSHKPFETLRNDLTVPKPRLDLFKTSLSYSGAKHWNELPDYIRSAPSLPSFKARVQIFLGKTGIIRIHMPPYLFLLLF